MKRFLLASIAVTLSSTTLAQNLVNRPGMVITNPINGISLNPSSNKILRAKIRELEATVEELQEQNEQLQTAKSDAEKEAKDAKAALSKLEKAAKKTAKE